MADSVIILTREGAINALNTNTSLQAFSRINLEQKGIILKQSSMLSEKQSQLTFVRKKLFWRNFEVWAWRCGLMGLGIHLIGTKL